MKYLFLIFIFISQLTTTAFAEEQTVTLSVPGMNCPVCPITVRKALEKVDGVSQAEVDYDSKRATVTFDDQATGTRTLMKATENVGYPSIVLEADPS
ncbi:MAG: mercury transporter [Gammaproteobacteria bacterium (ex Lamellibrachia satsuma)]|nr:MAG: mercury resistance system periplasmic binding protein MerP [Gammaproteobacteria bacterium (ex Lamellibrachia satsuma)]RRS33392.1 MAG: mercury transporter [Gammaproteobacteria bacterium (ex Lamellibrachia satsuma)]RRS35045.1 MAG: mercury transporter [Gammaproteobacteria bacterium (ex Lamellibrachia satsuma)]